MMALESVRNPHVSLSYWSLCCLSRSPSSHFYFDPKSIFLFFLRSQSLILCQILIRIYFLESRNPRPSLLFVVA
uniref:Uncharacterized protein n=1 Tax=Brassica oleracea var. oleracea TaxID=109376 RepID=A0A0D3A299_BRAOL